MQNVFGIDIVVNDLGQFIDCRFYLSDLKFFFVFTFNKI